MTLPNQLLLAFGQLDLILQEGQNKQRRAQETAEARRIQSESAASTKRVQATAKAESIKVVQQARVQAEGERMEIYRELPSQVMLGLAAQQLAGKLQRIDHLNLAGDSLGPLLSNLLQAGTERLEKPRTSDSASIDGDGQTAS